MFTVIVGANAAIAHLPTVETYSYKDGILTLGFRDYGAITSQDLAALNNVPVISIFAQAKEDENKVSRIYSFMHTGNIKLVSLEGSTISTDATLIEIGNSVDVNSIGMKLFTENLPTIQEVVNSAVEQAQAAQAAAQTETPAETPTLTPATTEPVVVPSVAKPAEAEEKPEAPEKEESSEGSEAPVVADADAVPVNDDEPIAEKPTADDENPLATAAVNALAANTMPTIESPNTVTGYVTPAEAAATAPVTPSDLNPNTAANAVEEQSQPAPEIAQPTFDDNSVPAEKV